MSAELAAAQAFASPPQAAPVLREANHPAPVSLSRLRLQAQLLQHCEAMLQHAMAMGLPVPAAIFSRLDTCLAVAEHGPGLPGLEAAGAQVEELAEISQILAAIVAPATPAAILLFAHERRRHPRLSAIGAVPLARQFLVLSAVSLVVTLLVSLASDVNAENMAKSFLHSEGLALLKVELFLLSSASLGSCFSILQKLNGYIAAGNYDPKYQATYWTRWVMGVISGVLLSQLLYSWLDATSSAGGGGGAGSITSLDLGQPALALLGGYSAGLMHRLLNRAMSAIETLFGGTRP
ncbi:hypothetical protein ACI6QG_18840 [Roseococcus sp. DSY-14]|uniref:hypothetical protein n=1 Tax=Roseococcus sp. DSY-14 TaxID=3369650 RepID=UPI00387AF5EC